MKTYIFLFIAYLFISCQSSQLRSQTKTLTGDCCCECPDCCEDPCVKQAASELKEATDELVQLLLARDQAENELLDIHDKSELVEHSLKCQIQCAGQTLDGLTSQTISAVGTGSQQIAGQIDTLSGLLSKAILAQNDQLNFLNSFTNPSGCVVKDIEAVIVKLAALEEEVYNLICGVQLLEYNSLKFKEQAITNENILQAILLQFGPVITNLFPSNLDQLTQLSASQIAELLGYVNSLFAAESARVNAIHSQTEVINGIRYKVWLALNEQCEKNANYQNALEHCQVEDWIKIYQELIELAKNCAIEQECCPFNVPTYTIPPLQLPPCECPPVTQVPPQPPTPVNLPPPANVPAEEVCPPECPPYERCPPCCH